MHSPRSFLRYSAFTLLGFVLSSCAYVIPDDPNMPRNNQVVGDRHKPQLNTLMPQSARSLPAPTRQITQAELPPVDAATKAQAEREIAAQAAPVSSATSERRVPVENVEFQVASDYPPLNAAPPRPALNGPGSAKERLSAVQSALEHDRTIAEERKAQLDQDAAQEPSMLSELPGTDGTVPPSDPVRVAPVEQPVPANPQIRPPAPALKPTSSAAPAGLSTYNLPPIVLSPPQGMIAPLSARPMVRPGDFDPLATSDTTAQTTTRSTSTSASSAYASNRYIAPSRYADRRYQ